MASKFAAAVDEPTRVCLHWLRLERRATNAGRAIELSWDGVGVFVEMFEEPSELSIRHEQQDTIKSGAQEALSWLARKK